MADDPPVPLYLSDVDPVLGLTQDLELHRFGQQIPPIATQSESCKHFGVHVVTWLLKGQSPRTFEKKN
jgi:hypothetical protein